MANPDLLSLVETLSNANGVSGFENDVVALIRSVGTPYGTFSEDSLRNLYLNRRGNDGKRPVVQLDAHSDEVGFIVQSVADNGTLRFLPLGSWLAANVGAQSVRVLNAEGAYIDGVVASKPPHFASAAERNAPPDFQQMVIDVGACCKREAVEQFGIRVGAPIVPNVRFRHDAVHDLMFGKAFDDRLGCAAILEAFRLLEGRSLQIDVVATWSSQEEVGTRGAAVSANTVKPDVAIVFEGCPADDTFTPRDAIQTAIKRGPMLRHMDSSMITNPRFQRFALDTAEDAGIPVQEGVRSGGGTNGARIYLSNMGVPIIVIGVPVRYAHTHCGIASMFDVRAAAELGAAIIERLNADVIAGF